MEVKLPGIDGPRAPETLDDPAKNVQKLSPESAVDRLPVRIEPKEVQRQKTSPESAVDRLPARIEPKEVQREVKEIRMDQVVVGFQSLPDLGSDADLGELVRQLKGQEGGINDMSVLEWKQGRERYCAEGRADEGNSAQKIARGKAFQDRIAENQNKGMGLEQATQEAQTWIKTQDALHNPDQIAGGDPTKVSGVGDSRVNKSIGAQWKSRVEAIDQAVAEFSKGKTPKELANCKMNVRLIVEG